MDDLFQLTIPDERMKHVKPLLEKHNRTDLTVVAVNKHYEFSYVCEDQNGSLMYCDIWNNKIDTYGVRGDFGSNFIIIDERFRKYESVYITKNKKFTSCARGNLEHYLSNGWEIEK